MKIWELLVILKNQEKQSSLMERDDIIENKGNDFITAGLRCQQCSSEFGSLKLYRAHYKEHVHADNIIEIQRSKSVSSDSCIPQIIRVCNTQYYSISFPMLNIEVMVNNIWIYLYDCVSGANPNPTMKSFTDGLNVLCESRYWLIFLYRSGCYASGVFDVTSKTFFQKYRSSRYTIRGKAGYSQIKCDKSKTIHSAGSSIRRDQYNKLMEDIKGNLMEWTDYVKMSKMILWMPHAEIYEVFSKCLGENYRKLIRINMQIDEVNSESLDKCIEMLTDTPSKTWR